jgi:hypothetical protein
MNDGESINRIARQHVMVSHKGDDSPINESVVEGVSVQIKHLNSLVCV